VIPPTLNTSRIWVSIYSLHKHPDDVRAFGFGDQ